MWYYALTISFSAFLLFQIQPLIGKFVLPWFGGTPAVWTICMLFFQVLLLLGYSYAHFLIRCLHSRAQRTAHLTVLFLSLLVLVVLGLSWKSPILPDATWKPHDSNYPIWRIVQLLAASVGLPFWTLSSTGPLVQGWFSHTHPGISPYRLYSLSNLGSLLALVSYPFLVEPTLSLKVQAAVWSGGYFAFAMLCGYCALDAAKTRAMRTESRSTAEASLEEGNSALEPILGRKKALTTDVSRPGWDLYASWLGLAGCASIMLLATTNQTCQEVAVIPFLWILPLCLYLLSFILCFESERWYSRRVFLVALLLAVGLASIVLYKGVRVKIWLQVLVYSFTLFSCCMFCHGELVGLKPSSRYLTSFYLMIATGGALGGIFVGLVAPQIFRGYWELQLGLWLTCFLVLVVLVRDHSSWLHTGHPWPAGVTLVGMYILCSSLLDEDFSDSLVTAVRNALRHWQTGLVAFTVTALMGIEHLPQLRFSRCRPWLAIFSLTASLGVLGFIFFSQANKYLEGAVSVSRNFYGVLVVLDEDSDDPDTHLLRLRHGRITHGYQFQSEAKRYLPTSYYGLNSGIGLALLHHPRRSAAGVDERSLRIGVVGLGVGTIAAYAQPGDTLRYYEINPKVIDLSLGTHNYFTYLKNCRGKVEVVLGDARISLERELEQNAPRDFDLLAIDAFTSDAIPVHLLTREAMAIYLKHLRMPTGIVAIHISNRYLDLRPVIWGLADHFGLASAHIDSEAIEGLTSESSWILLGQSSKLLNRLDVARATTPRNADGRPPQLWTDDYSNLFQILKK